MSQHRVVMRLGTVVTSIIVKEIKYGILMVIIIKITIPMVILAVFN